MCACFCGLLLAYAALVHCGTVNAKRESRIIADTKEESPPLIIDSKLNQIVTIYVPLVKGAIAKYYLTDPRGEERRLHIKYKERKKSKHNTEKLNNKSIKSVFNTNINSIQNTKDVKINTSHKKLHKEVHEIYNDSTDKFRDYHFNVVKYINKESVVREKYLNSITSHSRDNSSNEVTFHIDHHNKTSKGYIEEIEKDNKIVLPHINNITEPEDLINNSVTSYDRIYRQKGNQLNLEVNFVNLFERNDLINEYTEHLLHKNDFIQSETTDSAKDLKLKDVSAKQNVIDNKANKDINIFLNVVVEVTNLTEYEDPIFNRKRQLYPNFNIGPLIEDDHGNWVLSVFYKNGIGWVELFQSITVNIFERIPVKPKDIKLKEGDNYILRFSYPIEHLQSCELISPRAASDKYYGRYGQHQEYCGYIVKNVSKMEEGSWCIIGVGKIIYEACSLLQVSLGDFDLSITNENG